MGIFWGQDGIPGGVQTLYAEDAVQELPSKFPCRKTQPGDTLRTISPCGGGYGNPLERSPGLVLEDLLDGFLSIESARRDYGVVINPVTPSVQVEATDSLRQAG